MTNTTHQLLTAENCRDLARIMNLKYGAYLKQRSFQICAFQRDDVVQVEVILSNEKESFFYPVSARAFLEEASPTPAELVLLMLDFIDLYFDEYFKEDERVFIPIDWSSYHFEGVRFQMKGQDLERERLADDWLNTDR